jgi:hypothetical protein
MLEKVGTVNPLDDVFTFKRPPPEMAVGKTFVNCDVYGPANIILNGSTSLNDVRMDTCDFVMVKVNHPIANAIAFENTTFRNCNLYGLTFFIPEYLAKSFPAKGPNWITPNSPPQ